MIELAFLWFCCVLIVPAEKMLLSSHLWLFMTVLLQPFLIPSASFKYSLFSRIFRSISVEKSTSGNEITPTTLYSQQYSQQYSRQSKLSQPVQQTDSSTLTHEGILQVIRAFRAGQVSSPRSSQDSNMARSRPFLSSNAALATIGTTTTSTGQIALTSNTTNIFRYLLKSSVKSKFVDHVLAITSILLEYECMSSNEFLDALGLICERSHEEGLALLDEAVSYNIDINFHLFTPLLKSSGSAMNARKVLQRMEFFGFIPNVISFTTAIKSCEGAGDWVGALELFSLMKSVGVAPNERTYACAISAASRGLAADVALNMLNEMTLNDFPPNMICYGSALTACARCRMWPEVDVLFTQMVKSHMMLNQSVLSSVINVCRHPLGKKDTPFGSTEVSKFRSTSTFSPSASMSMSTGYIPFEGSDGIDIIKEREVAIDELDTESLSSTQFSQVITPNADIQWERAVYLLNHWSEHTHSKNESLYTLVMGICESVGKNNEIVDIFFKMIREGVAGTRNSCRYALRACVSGNLAEEAVRIVLLGDPMSIMKSFMLSEVVVMCERNGRYDCAIELVAWVMKTKYYNVPNAKIRSIITTSLMSYFVAYDSNGTLNTDNSELKAPSAESITKVLRGILTEHLSALMPTDSYGLAARLLYMVGDITSLRILLRDSLALPSFQAPTSSFFATRDGDIKNGRVSLFVNVIGFILYKRTNSTDRDTQADLGNTIEVSDSDKSSDTKLNKTTQALAQTIEEARYPDIRDIDLIIELFKDLCAAGHTKRVVDLLAKVISFYLKDHGTALRSNELLSYVPSVQSQPEKQSNIFKSKLGAKGKSGSPYMTSGSGGTNMDKGKVITIAAASDTERRLQRLERERDRVRAIHHLLREGRRVVHAYPHPVPLPGTLYKMLAQVYKDANLVEFMSEMFQFASEDNAVDRPLRDMVLSSLSSGHGPN